MLKVFGVGTVVSQPNLKKVEVSNTHVCNIRLAFNEVVGDGETKRVESHYFDFVLWDKGAEAAAKLLNKGDKMYVEGIARNQSWKDSEGKEYNKTVYRVISFTPIPKVRVEEPPVV